MINSLLGLELFAAFFSNKKEGLWLQSLVMVNMLLIPVLGARMIEYFGLTSNLGNIFYTFVILGYALILVKRGRQAVFDTLYAVFATLFFFFSVVAVLSLLPVLPGNEAAAALQNELFQFSERIIAASFAAQLPTIAILVFTMLYLPFQSQTLRYLVSFPIAQAVDSVIFFSVAFGDLSIGVEGFLMKIIFGLITAPLFFLLVDYKK